MSNRLTISNIYNVPVRLLSVHLSVRLCVQQFKIFCLTLTSKDIYNSNKLQTIESIPCSTSTFIHPFLTIHPSIVVVPLIWYSRATANVISIVTAKL